MTTAATSLTESAQLLLESFFTRRDIHGLCTADGDMRTKHDPILRVHLEAHLRGEIRIGAHCTAPDDTVRWGCIDIDKDHLPLGMTDREAVHRVVNRLEAAGFSCLVERSKSRGYHVWVFFTASLPAWKVRACLCAIVADVGLPDLEVNPKQNYLQETENGCGNYVFAPWHGGSRREGRTQFVDLTSEDWTPLPNQEQALVSVLRITPEIIEKMLVDKGITQPEPKEKQAPPEFSGPTAGVALDTLRIPRITKQLIVGGWTPGGPYTSRSELDAAVIVALVNGGHTDEEIRSVFATPAWQIGEKYREEGDHYLAQSIATARRFVAGNGTGSAEASADTTDKPEIDAGDHDLPRVAGAAWEALLAANRPPTIFRYGSTPSRLEHDDTGKLIVCPLNQDRLRHHLGHIISWYLTTTRNKKTVQVPALPPLHVVKDMLARPNSPLPVITRIVQAPVFAPDGTL